VYFLGLFNVLGGEDFSVFSSTPRGLAPWLAHGHFLL
jgi:hypothetical protein